MVGSRLYQNRKRVLFFLITYGLLGVLGVGLIMFSLIQGHELSGAEGFMLVFGAGMFLVTLFKSKKPVVLVYDEVLELKQTNKAEYVRFRNISAVRRPADDRLVLTVRDGHDKKDVTIWLKYLNSDDAERLADFLIQKKWKA